MDKPVSVDAYLAGLPVEQRRALSDLRATIRAAAPDAEETIAYGMPAYRRDGRMVVSFCAFKRHCSLFPASGAVMADLGPELGGYLSGKATLRFDPAAPIPTALVTKIVRIRLAELAAGTAGS
jgi:uncharacterized protein YdhG (YjbR/CyaY superfamily)